MLFFLSAAQLTSHPMVRATQFICRSAKLHFFHSYDTSSSEMKADDYSTKFTVIQHHE